MKIFYNIKRNLYFLIEKAKRNYLLLIIAGSVFLLGFILGIIFNENFIFLGQKEGNLFVISETGFFGCFFNLFLIFLKTIFIIFLFSLIKNLHWGTFFIIFLKGGECALTIIEILNFYNLIGVLFAIYALVVYLVMVFFIFTLFCYIKENQHCGIIIDRFTLLCHTKYFLKLLILSVVLTFFISLVGWIIINSLLYLV